jgi:hypothetical protein
MKTLAMCITCFCSQHCIALSSHPQHVRRNRIIQTASLDIWTSVPKTVSLMLTLASCHTPSIKYRTTTVRSHLVCASGVVSGNCIMQLILRPRCKCTLQHQQLILRHQQLILRNANPRCKCTLHPRTLHTCQDKPSCATHVWQRTMM